MPPHPLSEDRFRALAEYSPDLLAELDAEGRYLYINPSYQRVLGWRAEQLAGTFARDLVHPDDRQAARLEFDEMVDSGARARYHRLRVRHANGEWRWCETVAAAYRNADGAVHVLSSARDITDRVRNEARLEHANHLAATEEIVGSVAHAIRSPLTALLGTAGQLAERGGDESAVATRLLELARRIDRVVTRSLDLHQKGTLRLERVGAHELLKSALESCADRAAEKGVGVTVKTTADPPSATVDRALVLTAIESLAENAIDAAASGGQVCLTAEGALNGHALRIRVSDDGRGIPPELQRDVLKPFFTTKAGGTGLGVPIARGIVVAHGGTLTLAPREGGGTEASIELPCGGPAERVPTGLGDA